MKRCWKGVRSMATTIGSLSLVMGKLVVNNTNYTVYYEEDVSREPTSNSVQHNTFGAYIYFD